MAIAFLALAWVHHPSPGWNVNTRLNLVFAIVEEGTVRIDNWHATPPHDTNDKAVFEGHYYSDKTFGVSMLAVPFAAAMKPFWTEWGFNLKHYVLRVIAVGVPTAASVALLFLLLARLGMTPRNASLMALLAFFGSMWFGYGTVFYPYGPGLACVLGALYLILYPRAERIAIGNAAAVGFLLGYAMLCDSIFVIAVAGVGVLFLLRALDQVGWHGIRSFAEMTGERDRPKVMLPKLAVSALAFAVPAGAFAIYCYAIFGEFSMPYKYEFDETFRVGMSRGVMGVTMPDAHALYRITVHPFRGILVWSPLLVAAVAGCIIGTFGYGKRRMIGWLGIYSFVGYLLFNAGYYMWWGGWGMGPRFLIPMLPLVFLGLAELDPGRFRSWFGERKRLALGMWGAARLLGAVGVLLCVPLSLTEPQLPQANQHPVLESATWDTPLEIPQIIPIRVFYRGSVGLWPQDRIRGEIGSRSQAQGRAGIMVFFLLIGGAGMVLRRFLPEKSAVTRADYPFHSVDGSVEKAPAPF